MNDNKQTSLSQTVSLDKAEINITGEYFVA